MFFHTLHMSYTTTAAFILSIVLCTLFVSYPISILDMFSNLNIRHVKWSSKTIIFLIVDSSNCQDFDPYVYTIDNFFENWQFCFLGDWIVKMNAKFVQSVLFDVFQHYPNPRCDQAFRSTVPTWSNRTWKNINSKDPTSYRWLFTINEDKMRRMDLPTRKLVYSADRMMTVITIILTHFSAFL